MQMPKSVCTHGVSGLDVFSARQRDMDVLVITRKNKLHVKRSLREGQQLRYAILPFEGPQVIKLHQNFTGC